VQTEPDKAGQKDQLKLLLDTYLFQNLPDVQKMLLREAAVHFADTNWAEGINDIHFCFTVNPGNGHLEIWAVHDNNSQFQALDQRLWLKNREWEFFEKFFDNTFRKNSKESIWEDQ
jgi:hypothetical protein